MNVRRTILVGIAATFIATGSVGAGQTASSDQPRPDADNTARNVRDRDGQTRTPTDQGSSESDRDITARIRRDIVANDALSLNAHNVKIITVDGIVTLRGPVKTIQEKAAVAAAAQRAPGVRRVDNQIEIERSDRSD
jgi:osmotically-inducible protein OsmY